MFFMLSVPSPAARTSWRNMYAIASAPSAITKTMMISTRLPPERCTTAGLIPVMDLLLGILMSANGADCAMRPGDHVRRQWPRPHRVRRPVGVRGGPPAYAAGRGSARGEGGFGGVVDDEHLGQSGDPEDLQQPVLVAHQLERAVVGADLLQTADQHAEPGGVEELDLGHVDDEAVGAGRGQLGDLLAESRGGVDVDLPRD